ncbi:MFS transporter [Sinorhizobium meliloti]|uniref:Major facilitator superfamily transporter n=1 Tax=Rhizobium meliloti TaxID=382 RepID=I2E1N4_RHIML|nr:MFS transporter [Sinorhizobium meliloti]AFJ91402.1 major facilitator superfamily transporter [Sinorhizobium meliloti]MDW9645610.1 MFS transporter [Sinorhizobium meliloti]MQW44110.1 MFS transporter [Sinorhizobium meliloti]
MRVPKLITPWRSIAAGFLINGVLFGTWAGHIASVKDHFGLSDQDLSKLLLLLGLGALLSFRFAGRLCDSMGAPQITRAAACALLVATVFLGFAQTVQQLGLSLFLFGMCHGVLDVAINNWGSEVEKHMRRSVMSSFHAMFSLGAGLGAANGYVAAVCHVPMNIDFLITAGLTGGILGPLLLLDWQSTVLKSVKGAAELALPRGALLLVGLIAFSSGLGEGTAAHWGSVHLKEVIKTTEENAILGYVVFCAAMVVIRLTVDSLVTRLGSVMVTRLSGVSAACGISLIVAGFTDPSVSLVGFVLMGVGYAAIMPLAFKWAATYPLVPPGQAIATVATFAYGAMTLGPPAFGWLSEALSPKYGMCIVGIFAMLVAVLAPALDHK